MFVRLALALAVVIAALAVPAAAQAAPSGQWKVDCAYVRSAADDPIVFPGKPGASHLHDFFGNTGVSAYSTYESLKGVTSTCAHSDRSSYWVPALYRNGTKVKPSSFIAYYENRATAGTTIEPFPPGFRMVFGDKSAKSLSQVDVHIQWGCSDNTRITAAVPEACSSGAIQLRLQWPSCWDGTTSATGDATGHVGFLPGGVCKGHALPTIRTNIVYPVGTTTGDITLASGSVYSVHADFFNAWDQPTLVSLVNECLNGGQDCGHFRGTSPGRAAPPAPAAAPPAAVGKATPTHGASHATTPAASTPPPPDGPPAAAPEQFGAEGAIDPAAATAGVRAVFEVAFAAALILAGATGVVLGLRARRRRTP